MLEEAGAPPCLGPQPRQAQLQYRLRPQLTLRVPPQIDLRKSG